MKLSIIMPAYNESNTIATILSRVLEADLGDDTMEREILIVDDCSKDDTVSIVETFIKEHPENEIRLVSHDINQGKGAAVRTGFSQAAGDIFIIQDADLEYDPNEYKKLLEPILDGRADVCYGSRFLGGPHRVLYFWHYMANKGLTFLSNMLNNLNLTDMETCYKVFRREVIDSITLKSNRFGIEPELTAKVARKKFRIYEVPISYSGRTYEEGKKIGFKDGAAAFVHIFRFRFFD